MRGIRNLELNLGETAIGPTPSETRGRRDFRLSCAAARALPPGHVLAPQDIVFRRPGTGLPPAAAQWLFGSRLGPAVLRGHIFAREDFS